MEKVIKIKNDFKGYYSSAMKSIKIADYENACIYLNRAVTLAANQRELSLARLELSRLSYITENYYAAAEYANKVLSFDINNKEAKMYLMLNAIGNRDISLAKYYYMQCSDRVEKDKVINAKTIRQFFAIEDPDISVEERIKKLNKSFDFDCFEYDKKASFTVIDDRYKFYEYQKEAYEAAKVQEFEKAIEILDQSVKLKNVSDDDLGMAYHQKAICYSKLNKIDEAIASANRAAELIISVDQKLLKAELCAQAKKEEEVSKILLEIRDVPAQDFLQFIRAMGLFFYKWDWKNALIYLGNCPDVIKKSSEYYERLGKVYYNLGDIRSAKETFIEMGKLFGEMCDYQHYLFYIEHGSKCVILNKAMFGEWPELNTLYTDYLMSFFSLEKKARVKKIITERKQLFNAIEWLGRVDAKTIIISIISDIFSENGNNAKENIELNLLRGELLSLIPSIKFVNKVLNVQIAFEALFTQREYHITTNVNDRVFSIYSCLMDMENEENINVKTGYYLACAEAVNLNEKDSGKVCDTALQIMNLLLEKKVRWVDSGAIASLMVETAVGKNYTEDIPFVRYNKKNKQSYINKISQMEEYNTICANINN